MKREASEFTFSSGYHGGIAQLVEHLPCKQGVSGSIPLISTMDHKIQKHIENYIICEKNQNKKTKANF